jgi:tRNA-dihydrouridine synthase A
MYALPRFAVAPMMNYTDRHFRYLARLLTQQSLLYTEMITSSALLANPNVVNLAAEAADGPIALQLGGCDTQALASCVKLASAHPFAEINLNVGCPSDRVQHAQFGACLMAKPKLVQAAVAAMQNETDIPISVKTRLGIDTQDSYEFLVDFIGAQVAAGCKRFTIHARKAWLNGLNPKQNRQIPPLDYERVYRLKKDFPELHILINGGIENIQQAQQHLAHIDGVMMGRSIYQNPMLLSQVDPIFYDHAETQVELNTIAQQYFSYSCQQHQQYKVPLSILCKPFLQLFHGFAGAKQIRRQITEQQHDLTKLEKLMLEILPLA